jgi:hypothetical protein
MRILNNPDYDGMILNGRLLLKNGSTDPIGGGGGVWLYKPDNSAQLGFMGTQNSQNIGFFGGPGAWGFTYDAINSRVGIGNNNPNAPLAFGAILGKKITLYPGSTGNAGLGIAANRLQIYSDNSNADVAIGYDAAGTFNERFAVKANGALAIMGNAGTQGQLLVSNGSGANAEWKSAGNIIQTGNSGITSFLDLTGTGDNALPASAYTINLSVPSRVILYYKTTTQKDCIISCNTKWMFTVILDGAVNTDYFVDATFHNTTQGYMTDNTFGPNYFDLPAGNHNITFIARNVFNEPTIRKFQVMSMIIPQ